MHSNLWTVLTQKWHPQLHTIYIHTSTNTYISNKSKYTTYIAQAVHNFFCYEKLHKGLLWLIKFRWKPSLVQQWMAARLLKPYRNKKGQIFVWDAHQKWCLFYSWQLRSFFVGHPKQIFFHSYFVRALGSSAYCKNFVKPHTDTKVVGNGTILFVVDSSFFCKILLTYTSYVTPCGQSHCELEFDVSVRKIRWQSLKKFEQIQFFFIKCLGKYQNLMFCGFMRSLNCAFQEQASFSFARFPLCRAYFDAKKVESNLKSAQQDFAKTT